ncbi:septum formation initiator family protein [Candidatus Parcubacteria bacterium]|nr:septum formation initiator family protein [Candidatus Parcubacteria bacterium]
MRRLLNSKLTMVGVLFLIIWIGFGLIKIRAQRDLVRTQREDLESKIADLEQDNKYLASASDYFKSDAYLEKEARLKLNYKNADEEVAFVYRDTGEKKIPAEQAWQVQLSKMPNWQKWFYYILDK